MLSSSFYNNTLRAPQRTCTATGSRTQFQVWANAPYICISATPDFEENLIIVYVKEPSGVCHRVLGSPESRARQALAAGRRNF